MDGGRGEIDSLRSPLSSIESDEPNRVPCGLTGRPKRASILPIHYSHSAAPIG